MNLPAFAFPAEAGTHLPTPEGWKAELALDGWLVTYWNRCSAPGIEPDTVTHLSTNRVRRRLTPLIKANVLTTTPDHQTSDLHNFQSAFLTILILVSPKLDVTLALILWPQNLISSSLSPTAYKL